MPRPDRSFEIHRKLLENIRSGIYPHNSFLPPETELAREFGAARNTLRKAIAKLVSEGLIEKSQGKMSRVNCPGSRQHSFAGNLAWLSHLPPENMTGNAIYFEMFKQMVEKARVRNIGVHFFSLSPYQSWDNSMLGDIPWTGIFSVGLNSTLIGEENIRTLQKLPGLIAIDQTEESPEQMSISIDNYTSSRLAVEHLLQCGYKKITFVNHRSQQNQTFRERRRAYCDVMKKAGLQEYIDLAEPAYLTDFNLHHQQILSILKDHPQTEAFFCSTDSLALQLLQAAEQLNLKVPEQIALMGFDGTYAGQHIHPRLTTILQPLEAIVDTALNLVLEQSSGSNMPTALSIKIPGRVLPGETTSLQKKP